MYVGFVSAAEECVRPEAPQSVPDGATAGVEEMIAANKTVKQFVGDGTIYTDCVQPFIEQSKENAENADPADKAAANVRKAQLIKLHDSMVDEMKALANAFNLAVKAFNARE